MGEGVLAAERGQRPTLRGFDGNICNFYCTKRIVDDLRVGSGRNGTVRTNGDGQHSRHDYGHFSSRGITIKASVCGGRERDRGRARAARCVNGVGSGCGNGERSDHADREDEGKNLLGVFHCVYSFFIIKFQFLMVILMIAPAVPMVSPLTGSRLWNIAVHSYVPAGSSTSRAARSILLPTGIALL